jgi:hypothetical protein
VDQRQQRGQVRSSTRSPSAKPDAARQVAELKETAAQANASSALPMMD